MMKKAVIGIGTNEGDRKDNINSAVNALSLVPSLFVKRVSPLYETKPWGFTEQQNFYNCVCEVETELSPEALLGVCLGIEAGIGRVRKFKNGPRVIDLDLLVYENETRSTAELMLPHPGIGERAFVLSPLADLYDMSDVLGLDYKTQAEKYAGSEDVKRL